MHRSLGQRVISGYWIMAMVFAVGALIGGTIVYGITHDNRKPAPAYTLIEPVNSGGTAYVSDIELVTAIGNRNQEGICQNPGILEGHLVVGMPRFVGLVFVDDATCTFQFSIGDIVGDIPNEMDSVTDEEVTGIPIDDD